MTSSGVLLLLLLHSAAEDVSIEEDADLSLREEIPCGGVVGPDDDLVGVECTGG